MAISMSGYTTQRISGLVSGMDTTSIVNNLLKLEESKVNKVIRQREKAQWKQDAYSEINTAVSSMRNTFLSVMGDNSMLKSSTYNKFTVKMDENSSIKITAGADAVLTSFQIKSVQAAAAAGMTSFANSRRVGVAGEQGQLLQAYAKGTNSMGNITDTTTVGDLASRFELSAGQNLSFSINGETFSFDQSTKINDMMAEINASETAGVTMSVGSNGLVSIESDSVGATTALNMSNITGTAFGTARGFGVSNTAVRKQSFLDENTTFADLTAKGMDFGTPNASGEYSFKINGQSFTFKETDQVLDVMDDINSNASAGVTMSFSESSGTFRLSNSDTNANTSIRLEGSIFEENGLFGVGNGTYSSDASIRRTDTLAAAASKLGSTIGDTLDVTVNGKNFSFKTSETTLRQMMDTITKSDAGATFSFNELTDTFSISSSKTGSASSLDVTGLEVFGLSASRVQDENFQITAGKDAIVTLGDGKSIVQSSNVFTLDGMTFEIYNDYNTDAAAAQSPLNVSLTQDASATVDKFKKFVEEYNKLVETLNTYYNGTVNRAYQPLTDDERADMSETEATLWDEKAKAGLLRNDEYIGSLLSGLRGALSVKVEGTGMSAFDLGITTTSWNGTSWKTDSGKIELDEDKLLAALAENPNAVHDVFAKLSTTASGAPDTSVTDGVATSGLFYRMNGIMSGFNSEMRTQTSSTQTKIDSFTTKISDLLDRMAEKEEKYWAQYSAMEAAMSEMQSQQNWLTSQLGLSS